MISGNALRHQMILPEQQAIFDYWRSKCRGGRIPSRSDIDPTEIASYLPTVSLLDIEGSAEARAFRFRLAGTGLYDVFSREITGTVLTDLPMGSRRAYWDRVLNRVVDRAKPSAGAMRSAISGKTHIAQFWVRLPLSDDGEKVSMILGFDKFVKLSDVASAEAESSKIPA